MNTGHTHLDDGGNRFLGSMMMAAAVLLATAVPLRADDKQGTVAYLQGLDALSAGKWADAVAAFSKAADADEDNPDYLTARGVARAVAQEPAAAIKDLQRSMRMRADDWETKLW